MFNIVLLKEIALSANDFRALASGPYRGMGNEPFDAGGGCWGAAKPKVMQRFKGLLQGAMGK